MLSTIFITTPCLNAVKTLDRTIHSVVSQAGNFFICFHVQDGGSTDGTIERLNWWQRQLRNGIYPIHCSGIEFTYASEADEGMYDALCRGFSALNSGKNNFMTWINADDIVAPGAFQIISEVERQFTPQQVSWVSGASSILRGDIPVVSFDNPIPTEAIKAGVCDGVHWNFLQQEGTFFRRWLWQSINPNQTIRPMKLAGDWRIWYHFSRNASLVQSKFSLAWFRISDDQLSARLRKKYMGEIDEILPESERRQALAMLAENKKLTRRFLGVQPGKIRLSIYEEQRSGILEKNYLKVFGKKPNILPVNSNPKLICDGVLRDEQKVLSLKEITFFGKNIVAYDRDWQFPAITEKHAYHQLRDLGTVPEGVTYVAYPWANLIDKLQTKASDAHSHLIIFREFCRYLPRATVKITVCQHIKMQEYIHLFESAGINEIFWTHTTQTDVASVSQTGLVLRPFPLYPVQVSKEELGLRSSERQYLFSFIGAKSNHHYLTQSRDWIIDLLSEHPRGLVVGRNSWHYNKIVYDHQISTGHAAKNDAATLVDHSASVQFKESLANSIFSLCPAGSGPNSIRLWESLGAGSIPVILADTYAPPGNPDLWNAAVVFCEETPEAIQALPEKLEKIAADPARLDAMRHAMRQLWTLYGPHSFVYDVQKRMLELGASSSLNPLSSHPKAKDFFRQRLTNDLAKQDQMTRQEAQTLLRCCSGDLLLEGTNLLGEFEGAETSTGRLLAIAQNLLSDYDPVLQHYRNVIAHIQQRTENKSIKSFYINKGSKPVVCLFGQHSNRTPLNYLPFQKLVREHVSFVQEPECADIIMTGFNLDIRENSAFLEKNARKNPNAKIMVISEEPLWDSIWSGGFIERERIAKCGDIDIKYIFLNHSNSKIFDFEKIPYFLLTNCNFLTRYSLLIAQHSSLTPQELLTHWEEAPIRAAFYAEVRDGDVYASSFPERAIFGLSAYRTEVARKTTGNNILRVGKGWLSETRRQDLPDWHLDKFAALDMQTQVVSAYENTHQKSYISEKIFDSFVIGGVPIYYADEKHKIFDLVPESCFINTYNLSSAKAAQKISNFSPDRVLAESWLETTHRLQQTFKDEKIIKLEYERVISEILNEIKKIV